MRVARFEDDRELVRRLDGLMSRTLPPGEAFPGAAGEPGQWARFYEPLLSPDYQHLPGAVRSGYFYLWKSACYRTIKIIPAGQRADGIRLYLDRKGESFEIEPSPWNGAPDVAVGEFFCAPNAGR